MDLLIRDGSAALPDNGSGTLFVLSIAFVVLSSVVVTGRLVSRLLLKKSFGNDDVAIVMSLVSTPLQMFVLGFCVSAGVIETCYRTNSEMLGSVNSSVSRYLPSYDSIFPCQVCCISSSKF